MKRFIFGFFTAIFAAAVIFGAIQPERFLPRERAYLLQQVNDGDPVAVDYYKRHYIKFGMEL